jgi:hypothetical protein
VTAGQVLRETVDDIFADPRASLVCLVPLVFAFALIFAAVVALELTYGTDLSSQTESAQIDTGAVGWIVAAVIALVLIMVTSWLWTAVAWHRMVILGEKPGFALPPWRGGKFLGYFARTILISILLIFGSIPLLAVAAIFAPDAVEISDGTETGSYYYGVGTGPSDFSPLGLIVWLAVTAIIYGFSLRLGLILPAGAVGRAMPLGEAWQLTSGKFASLFLPLGVLLTLVDLCINFVASLVSFGGVLDMFALGLTTLIGIGVLTRLYMGFVSQGTNATG